MNRPATAATERDWDALLAAALEKRGGAQGWTARRGAYWHQLKPVGTELRAQGWKIHLSATAGNCTEVLERVVDTLLAARCAFKFVAGQERYRRSVSRRTDRASAGKLITVYPNDDGQFRELAEALDRATRGLTGPVILTDRPYRPGSLVQYRYGAFAGRRVLGDNGLYASVLVAPDGTLVPDDRSAWFCPPPWAVDPLAEEASEEASGAEAPCDGPRAEEPAGTDVLLLDGRYEVTDAIRHTSRGGVYRALDVRTGRPVVLKQARPHIDAQADGADARDLLRNEARMLGRLAPTGYVPRFLGEFEVDEDLFVVQEELPGRTLHEAMEEAGSDTLPDLPAVLDTAARLVAMVAAVHAEGVVLGDFAPGNVLVDEEGRVRLIDLETAAGRGAPVPALATPFFTAPERARTERPSGRHTPAGQPSAGPVADPASDLYCLGALLFLLVLRQAPVLLPDEPADPAGPSGRDGQERIAAWLDLAGRQVPAAARLRPLVVGLMASDPARRWTLERAARFVEDCRATAPEDVSPAARRTSAPDGAAGAWEAGVLSDSLDHLAGSLDAGARWLWPVPTHAEGTLPGSLQHGAAGGAGVLLQAWERRGSLGLDEERWYEALSAACRWYDRALDADARVVPGLHFGHAGIAWTAYELAAAVGDTATAGRALDLARRLPVRWPNPDVTHGLAGGGTALLHLWRRTGDPVLERRWKDCADGLALAAERFEDESGRGQVGWRVREVFPEARDRGTFHGFAHGTAGICSFLLAAAQSGADGPARTLAEAGGRALVAAALADGPSPAAFWGESPDEPPHRRPHWCHGSAGVGTFLLRLWQATGAPEYRVHAERAALAVARSAPYAPVGHCHGLSGFGHFLLDMADAFADPGYREQAEACAELIEVRHARRAGRRLLPSDSGLEVGFDHAGGMAGALGFLIRLRHGGPGPWVPAPTVHETPRGGV
ncbi:class IV lanthionine synthetase LanL [Streptomyces sp. NPDC004284]|uniref:class IV lanthionine synthetase LanL n=1 Tax=Streptomyces sp. NPDC004284 TaxID=3364695 RepID=UPI00368FFCB8